jgi:PKD repeat protein
MRPTRSLYPWCTLILLSAVVGCGKDSSTGPTPNPNAGPDAKFSYQCAALSCDFHEFSTDADGQVTAWNWNFGDNTGSSLDQNPTYTFATAGTYSVTLTASDDSGATNSLTKQVAVSNPAVTSLSCVDGSTPGGYVACKLKLEAPAGYKVVLNSHDCDAHHNIFRIVEPVVDTLTKDGCYETQTGKQILRPGPYPAGTEISAEVIAPFLANPPQLRVSGSYPEWTLTYEDGQDQDFNDLVLTVTALPQ